jgi:hypothetical protein
MPALSSIITASALAVAGGTAYSALSAKKPKAPEQRQPPAAPRIHPEQLPATLLAARQRGRARAGAGARAQTLLTGARGILDEAPVERKTLLGQ